MKKEISGEKYHCTRTLPSLPSGWGKFAPRMLTALNVVADAESGDGVLYSRAAESKICREAPCAATLQTVPASKKETESATAIDSSPSTASDRISNASAARMLSTRAPLVAAIVRSFSSSVAVESVASRFDTPSTRTLKLRLRSKATRRRWDAASGTVRVLSFDTRWQSAAPS